MCDIKELVGNFVSYMHFCMEEKQLRVSIKEMLNSGPCQVLRDLQSTCSSIRALITKK